MATGKTRSTAAAERGPSKRHAVMMAAVSEVYQRGFGATTMADVAEAAGVPLGSVYYYLKTKEEFGSAVIDFYDGRYRALVEQWSKSADPRARLKSLVRMSFENRKDLVRLGCPIGSLSTELRKGDDEVAGAASRLFSSLLEWIEQQFSAMGRTADAASLAIQLLSALEGATLVAHSLGRVNLIEAETKRLMNWLDTL